MTDPDAPGRAAHASGPLITGQDVHAMWGGEITVRGEGSIECVEGLSAPVSIVRNTCTGTGIFRRSAKAVRRFEQAFHAITFIESGELAIQPSHDAIRIARGQFMVTKTSTGYQAEMACGTDSYFDNFTVRVADHRMLPHVPGGVKYGHAMSAADGAGAAARDLAKYLFAHGKTLGTAEVEVLTDVFLRLVAEAVQREGAQLPARLRTRERHLQAILNIIDQNIADSSLSLADVARRLKISTRYVSMILSEQGLSFRELVRSRRMVLARRLLSGLDMERYPIAKVAEICGFKSASHFSTAFKKSEGVTASSYRLGAY